MELLYLWIDRYNNILNQGFNFSSEYNIQYDDAKKQISIAQSNKKKLQLFNESFINVTAIIGKNGSGKSSIFSALKEFFSDDFRYHDKVLIVVKKEDGKLLLINKAFPENDKFEIDKPKDLVVEDVDKNVKITTFVDLIFNSNSFSIYEERTFKKGYVDISFSNNMYRSSVDSNYLLLKQYEELIELSKKEEFKEEEFDIIKSRIITGLVSEQQLYKSELKQKLEFISKYSDHGYDFIPTTVRIFFNAFFISKSIEQLKNLEGVEDVSSNVQQLLFTEQFIDVDNTKKLFKERMLVSLTLLIISRGLNYQADNFDSRKVWERLGNADKRNSLPEYLENLLINLNVDYQEYHCFKIKQFVLALDTFVDKLDILTYPYRNTYTIAINDSLKEFLHIIYDFWDGPEFIFGYEWHGLSAGQSALLSLFSKFNSVSKYLFEDKTTWILLDEGDLYLHPEWQRQFFNDLHKYLPLFFRDKKIQLFLTSHSPFLVSDLPKENILLLSADKNSFSVLVDKENISNTFGANIHELLANSFFLNKGTVGEFAKVKINDLFYFLVDKDFQCNWTDETAMELIELVGEPILKRQLIQLFDKKFESNHEIQFLESELERMKKRQKKNDKNNT